MAVPLRLTKHRNAPDGTRTTRHSARQSRRHRVDGEYHVALVVCKEDAAARAADRPPAPAVRPPIRLDIHVRHAGAAVSGIQGGRAGPGEFSGVRFGRGLCHRGGFRRFGGFACPAQRAMDHLAAAHRCRGAGRLAAGLRARAGRDLALLAVLSFHDLDLVFEEYRLGSERVPDVAALCLHSCRVHPHQSGARL